MKIKAELKQPYTEQERLTFIVEQNHNFGYEIREVKEGLQAWGYTEEELAQQEQERLVKEFFKTSLGYVKRKVTMANNETRDFLFDIKPTLQVGIPIITYNLDGSQNRDVIVTKEFLKECDAQVYFDFYGSYPSVEGSEINNENTTDTTTDNGDEVEAEETSV